MSANSGPLTLERMRADIAEVLLETPDRIGDGDNLVDLGLDSLRTMTLVTLWREGGVELDFGDLVTAEPSLAGWWAVVMQRQADTGEG